jgi:fumarate reductase subunit D
MSAGPTGGQDAWRGRAHPAYWASIVHRVSGILLAVFLPFHFLALGTALSGDAALEGFLAWTHRPWVEASEVALVALLATHLTGGLRLLLIEFVGWRRESQALLLAVGGGAAAGFALAFALNLF